MPIRWILLYAGVVSLIGMILTVSDKCRAKRGLWRVPEATLMTVGALGGALVMFLTMQSVRHKTKHPKFMVGLPVFFVLHLALCLWLWKNGLIVP